MMVKPTSFFIYSNAGLYAEEASFLWEEMKHRHEDNFYRYDVRSPDFAEYTADVPDSYEDFPLSVVEILDNGENDPLQNAIDQFVVETQSETENSGSVISNVNNVNFVGVSEIVTSDDDFSTDSGTTIL